MHLHLRDCRGLDSMLVGFTTTYAISAYIPTKVVSLNPNRKVYWTQLYVIKFVSDLRWVSGFIWVLQFPPPIKLTAMM
jgi:hypothetical protein